MTNTYYDCAICLEVNHSSRLQCQHCGTVPAKYSILGVPAIPTDRQGDWFGFIPVVAAHGCYRAVQHHAARVNLRTVALEYYAAGAD